MNLLHNVFKILSDIEKSERGLQKTRSERIIDLNFFFFSELLTGRE